MRTPWLVAAAIAVTLLGGAWNWSARAGDERPGAAPHGAEPGQEPAQKPGPKSVPETAPVPMRVARDVVYHTENGVDAARLSLDVYAPGEALPEGSAGRPVMLFVHGGGWALGDKRHVGRKPKFFTDAGWVLVATNYRFVPEGRHPVNVQDVARAIAWTRTNVAEYGGDADSIFLMGHSAGAHLAALAAIDGRRLEAVGQTLGAVRGVVLLDGAGYDVKWRMETAGEFSERLYRNAFGDDEALWQDASPVTHVKKGAGIPPFLITYVAARRDAGIAARRLAVSLRRAGVRADVYAARGKTHATINRELGKPGDAVTLQVLAFLSEIREMPRAAARSGAHTEEPARTDPEAPAAATDE